MEPNLTKDAKFMLKTVYDEYDRRIRNGESKNQAKDFTDLQKLQSDLFPTWPVEDITKTAAELRDAGFVRLYIRSGFLLEDSGISWAENAVKRGILTVLDAIDKLKP